jgi:molybdopterin converting factor small subunit
MSKKKIKKSPDPFIKLKYVAYCLSQMPENKNTIEEFVEFAKFKLCIKNKLLMKDPIWDAYKREDILVEYFAHQMEVSKESREELEKALNLEGTAIDDFSEWADKEIEKNKEELEGTMGHDMGDSVKFNPSDVLGDE